MVPIGNIELATLALHVTSKIISSLFLLLKLGIIMSERIP